MTLRARDEEGQVIPMLAVGMLVILLAFAGLVIDVGHAYVVKQKLQAAADAAALAAADSLPDASAAAATTGAYGTHGLNSLANLPVTESTSAWCLKSITYCYGGSAGSRVTSGNANGVVVTESVSVPTTFLKVVGIDNFTVNAKATACGMCGTQALDIVIVADRTGSMVGNMGDLRSGLLTFLGALDPKLDSVSLLVLPPAANGSACDPASGNSSLPLTPGDSFPAANDSKYAVVDASTDYLVDGKLNQSSRLVSQINCMAPNGATAYKQALQAAMDELARVGRKNAQGVIVFESDGAANIAPDSWYDATSGHAVGGDTLYSALPGHEDDILRPCGSAVDLANSLKSSNGGPVIFTVGYRLGEAEGCYQSPHITGSIQHGKSNNVTWTGVKYMDAPENMSAGDALAGIASPGSAFQASNAAQMSTSFASIANKLQGAKLVPDSEAGS